MVRNFFWDSNIFIAYLNQESAYSEYLDDITKILNCPDITVYSSQLALTEVSRRKIRASETKSFTDFINSFQQKIILIQPSSNIWTIAGELKDLQYRKNNSHNRKLSTGDALMLATALELKHYKIKLDAFHTFDDGKAKDSERKGKCIPILSYHQWVDNENPSELAREVINLNRCKPRFPF